MKHFITIPEPLSAKVRNHLFQNELEQGVFLLAQPHLTGSEIDLRVTDAILIAPEGWEAQLEVYLEMKDAERARVMQQARLADSAVIDCHSHPGSGKDVWFSPSDKQGIVDFAAYVKWKLKGKPYAAMVWGEESVDAVLYHGDFSSPNPVDQVRIINGRKSKILVPRANWNRRPKSYWTKNHGR